jgi:hypothetical protein
MTTEHLPLHTTQDDENYDDSLPPLWQSVIELGASLPLEVWEHVPVDLASNLNHYLYGNSGNDE